MVMPEHFLSDNADLVNRLANKAGYWYTIKGLEAPKRLKSGSAAPIRVEWQNLGVAPCYYRYYAELLLVNAENGIVQHGGMLESSDNRNWMPGEISEEVYNLEIPEALEAGAYKLKIGLFENQKMQKRPIELALKDDIKDQNGYYEIAELIVE